MSAPWRTALASSAFCARSRGVGSRSPAARPRTPPTLPLCTRGWPPASVGTIDPRWLGWSSLVAATLQFLQFYDVTMWKNISYVVFFCFGNSNRKNSWTCLEIEGSFELMKD